MQIELKTISHCVVVYTSSQPACPRQRFPIDSGLHSKTAKLVGRSNGMPSTSSADHNAEIREPGIKTPLQSSHYGRGNTGRVPIHSHDGTKGLEPEWIAKTCEQFAHT